MQPEPGQTRRQKLRQKSQETGQIERTHQRHHQRKRANRIADNRILRTGRSRLDLVQHLGAPSENLCVAALFSYYINQVKNFLRT
jgi:hypothetical protein